MDVAIMKTTLVAVVMAAVFLSGHVYSEPAESMGQQSSYHLNMLKETVDQIKQAWAGDASSQRIVKRSSRLDADDLILKSVDSYCTNFKSDPALSRYLQESLKREPLSLRDISHQNKYKKEMTVNGGEDLSTIPLKVQAQKEMDKVWLIFHIAHTGTATIARIEPYNFQKVVVEMPNDSCEKKMVTKARFVVEAPISAACGGGMGKNSPSYASALFQTTANDDEGYTVTTFVNLCGLNSDIFSENIPQPKVVIKGVRDHSRFDSERNIISIQKDSDHVFDLKADIAIDNPALLTLLMWDSDRNDTIQSRANVSVDVAAPYSYSDDKIRIDFEHSFSRRDNIFQIQILSKSEPNNEHNYSVSLRISLSKQVKHRTGKLFLVYSKDYSGDRSRRIVRRVRVQRVLRLEQEGQDYMMPGDLINFGPKERFLCNTRGNLRTDDYSIDGHCTVECHVTGFKVSAIYITGKSRVPLPVAAMPNYIMPHSATATLDVGPASDDVEGDYRCTVVDGVGQTKIRNLRLYTRLFTRVKSFYVHDHATNGNGSDKAVVVCDATGDNDLNISITAVSMGSENETRLDDDGAFNKTVVYDGVNQTSLSLEVPWDDLKLPRQRLYCHVQGDRGEYVRTLGLSQYKKNYKGFYPEITLVTMKHFRNGTSVLECHTKGTLPMEVWMNFDGLSRTPIIRGLIYSNQTIDEEKETSVLTYHARTLALRRNRHYGLYNVYCHVKNKYLKKEEGWYVE